MIPLIWAFDQLLTPLNPKEHTVSWSQDFLYPFHNNPSPHFSFVQKYFTLPIALLTQKCTKHHSEISVMQVTWHPSERSYHWDIYLLTKFQSLRPFIDSPVTHSGVQRSLPRPFENVMKESSLKYCEHNLLPLLITIEPLNLDMNLKASHYLRVIPYYLHDTAQLQCIYRWRTPLVFIIDILSGVSMVLSP